MSKINEIVDSIINELDGRKGFDFYDLDEDILDEIKSEIAKLILPVVGISFGEKKTGCLGFKELDTGNGSDYDCGYDTKLDCDDCKYGRGRKNPASKVNRN